MNPRTGNAAPDRAPGEDGLIPAVVINLDRHPDRLAWFMENAARRGLAVERIAAIDGRDPANAAVIEALRAPGASLGRSELACTASHRLAWQWLLDSGRDFVAVFEDDAHLADDIRYLLRREMLPPGIDVVKLEAPTGKVSFARRPTATHGGRGLHRLLTRAYGAGGYVLSRRAATRLLELTAASAQPVDVVVFDDYGRFWAEFPILQMIPAACIQELELARLGQRPERFASALAEDRSTTKDVRKNEDGQRRDTLPLKKFRRYVRCVWHGANPFRHRARVPLDLGTPAGG